MMNIDTSTMVVPFKNKDDVVHHPPTILARQQSDESYTPLPLSLPVVVVVVVKKKGQELSRTPTSTMSSLSLSSLSLKDNIDRVLHILKDDDSDDGGGKRKRKQTESPTSTMDTIYKKRAEGCFDVIPFSITTAFDNDDTTTSRSSSILASSMKRGRCEKHVRFNPYCQIKDTLSHKNYTPQERYNTYLQYNEFQLIRHREYLLMSKMESLLKQSYKLASYQEVFIEQEKQEECQEYEYYECCNEEYGNRNVSSQSSQSSYPSYYCIYNDQAIANAYSEISMDCRIRAKEVALKNRQEVERYYL
jgi:hypothetical protein